MDDSDIFRIEVATGKTEKLLEHPEKQIFTVADVSRLGRTLLVISNAMGGSDNVALLDSKTKKLEWLRHTPWSVSGGAFTPDGRSVMYVLDVDSRISTRFLDLKTMQESERGLPPGMNEPAVTSRPFLPDGILLLLHQDSSHPQELHALAKDAKFTQSTHNANETLQNEALPKSQLVNYKTFDGRLISAFVWVPFNLKELVPLRLW